MRQKIYAYIEDEFSIFHDFMWKWSSMLNYLWAAMIVIGIVYGAFTGNMTAVSDGALDSAKEAVTLCITMLGVMSLWTGLMEIANRSGLIDKCTKAILPLMQWLFPGVPKDHDAMQHITTNVIANFLGLGWAATPAGLRAMKALSELNVENSRASTDMCTFLVINISFDSADSGQYYCIPQPVRQCESDGNCSTGNSCDHSQYTGCDCIL